MPGKQVIILDRLDDGTGNQQYRVVYWADVPVARQTFYANKQVASIWAGASGTENTAIQSGAVVEKIDTISVPKGTSLATVQAQLQNAAQEWQTLINNTNPWARYGSFFDGTTWTAAGVV